MSQCPKCGHTAFLLATSAECSNPKCQNFHPNMVQEAPRIGNFRYEEFVLPLKGFKIPDRATVQQLAERLGSRADQWFGRILSAAVQGYPAAVLDGSEQPVLMTDVFGNTWKVCGRVPEGFRHVGFKHVGNTAHPFRPATEQYMYLMRTPHESPRQAEERHRSFLRHMSKSGIMGPPRVAENVEEPVPFDKLVEMNYVGLYLPEDKL